MAVAEDHPTDLSFLSDIDQPPLPMQTSSQFIEDRLDIKHGGGGENSADGNEPAPKKMKLYDDSKEEPSGFDSSYSLDGSSITSECPFSKNRYDTLGSKLEFDILDEFEGNDADDQCMDDGSSDSENEISDEEIYAMLDEGLKSQKSANVEIPPDEDDLSHEEKEKVILKVRGRDHFDVLPEGWIEVSHNSGMPVYLHKQSRVCCMSKPYFLGPGSARKHEIPISAIPCLQYSRELEKESQSVAENTQQLVNGRNGADNNDSTVVIPSAKLESIEESRKESSLDCLTVREYCEKKFEFQTIKIKRFKTWIGRRKHLKMVKQAQQRPTLPESTKLITCPLPVMDDKGQSSSSSTKREFIMNPSGKSAVCILHEYVQHTLRVQPRYIFKELENASTPYGAVVVINNMEYGSGLGSSKKQAKSEAAKSALEVLIPKMQLFNNDGQNEKEAQDVEFFDQVRVEDPRVCELCVKAGQPYPYQILLECLKRNYGMGNTDIHFGMRNLKHQKNEFTITVGKHKASVMCKNKRDGKQRASQAILKLLHPQIQSWGSLLRMYGIGSRQTLKEKKVEEQRITELQSKACANKPNMSILNKLKEEMLKYRRMKESLKPIGKLVPEIEFLSTSDSNLKNVEL